MQKFFEMGKAAKKWEGHKKMGSWEIFKREKIAFWKKNIKKLHSLKKHEHYQHFLNSENTLH